jgi:Holliday junction resolvase RusA-like endonuclease
LSRSLRVVIAGKPQQQGSKSAYLVAGRIKLVEANKNLMPWRTGAMPIVQQALFDQDWEFPHPEQAVTLEVAFYFEKPKTSKRLAMTTKPDTDHLIRAVGDLLTQAGAITDDSQITRITAVKEYGEPRTEILLTF